MKEYMYEVIRGLSIEALNNDKCSFTSRKNSLADSGESSTFTQNHIYKVKEVFKCLTNLNKKFDKAGL